MKWHDRNAVTFEEAVIRLIVEKRTKEPEFQRLLALYGREKIEKIYRDWRARGCVFLKDLKGDSNEVQ